MYTRHLHLECRRTLSQRQRPSQNMLMLQSQGKGLFTQPQVMWTFMTAATVARVGGVTSGRSGVGGAVVQSKSSLWGAAARAQSTQGSSSGGSGGGNSLQSSSNGGSTGTLQSNASASGVGVGVNNSNSNVMSNSSSSASSIQSSTSAAAYPTGQSSTSAAAYPTGQSSTSAAAYPTGGESESSSYQSNTIQGNSTGIDSRSEKKQMVTQHVAQGGAHALMHSSSISYMTGQNTHGQSTQASAYAASGSMMQGYNNTLSAQMHVHRGR
jgi:hypothetical protein